MLGPKTKTRFPSETWFCIGVASTAGKLRRHGSIVSRRLSASLQAVLVAFLWSTSCVLIKVGLHGDLPALTRRGKPCGDR